MTNREALETILRMTEIFKILTQDESRAIAILRDSVKLESVPIDWLDTIFYQ